MIDTAFYSGKKIFVTGHTGFKGSWMTKILLDMGADVTGFALDPPTNPSLFEILNLKKDVYSITGDIRDYEVLRKAYQETKPDIVFHLAAQPIVKEGYRSPRYTYETNVMGTVNLLECVRNSDKTCSLVNITTDKVYENHEWPWGYREIDQLNGYDPYSNSKSCSELVTSSYINSFFRENGVAVSTARAGNVIGGGDFAADRIIPDCVRAAIAGETIIVRNPFSIRPYQHVLEPIFAYLQIAKEQYKDISYSGNYNVGPNDDDCIRTGELVDCFVQEWGHGLRWVSLSSNGPHEANYLKLDCSLIKSKLRWHPCWNIRTAVKKTVEWVKCWLEEDNLNACMDEQIKEYMSLMGGK